MQFAVPQFTEIEDKLIGPLTFKQFLVLLGVGGILFFFWSILGAGIIFFFLAIPIGGVGAYVAFGKFNGRQLFVYALPMVNFLISPRAMVFKREEAIVSYSKKSATKVQPSSVAEAEKEEPQSRLRRIAYLLDQKNEEEKDIISHSSAFVAEPQTETQTLKTEKLTPKPNFTQEIKTTQKPIETEVQLPPPQIPDSFKPKPEKFDPSKFLRH